MVVSIQGDHLSGKPGNVSEFGTCQGNVRDVVNSQGIVREMSEMFLTVRELSGKCQGKNLVMESVPKLFITRWILAFSLKNSAKLHMYIVISPFVIINYEIIVNLIVWSFTFKLVLQACYEYHLTWAWVPHIVREMWGNFRVFGEWSPWVSGAVACLGNSSRNSLLCLWSLPWSYSPTNKLYKFFFFLLLISSLPGGFLAQRWGLTWLAQRATRVFKISSRPLQASREKNFFEAVASLKRGLQWRNINSSNCNLYLLICLRGSCFCFSRNNFCLPLDVTTTNNLS